MIWFIGYVLIGVVVAGVALAYIRTDYYRDAFGEGVLSGFAGLIWPLTVACALMYWGATTVANWVERTWPRD